MQVHFVTLAQAVGDIGGGATTVAVAVLIVREFLKDRKKSSNGNGREKTAGELHPAVWEQKIALIVRDGLDQAVVPQLEAQLDELKAIRSALEGNWRGRGVGL